ncbi:hypothetical protein CDD83_1667 [Cordyceps sp. RAO-2017]|nr:hypothetical protein CDD83_1667 [Cordyceps sp. RAO-2017]
MRDALAGGARGAVPVACARATRTSGMRCSAEETSRRTNPARPWPFRTMVTLRASGPVSGGAARLVRTLDHAPAAAPLRVNAEAHAGVERHGCNGAAAGRPCSTPTGAGCLPPTPPPPPAPCSLPCALAPLPLSAERVQEAHPSAPCVRRASRLGGSHSPLQLWQAPARLLVAWDDRMRRRPFLRPVLPPPPWLPIISLRLPGLSRVIAIAIASGWRGSGAFVRRLRRGHVLCTALLGPSPSCGTAGCVARPSPSMDGTPPGEGGDVPAMAEAREHGIPCLPPLLPEPTRYGTARNYVAWHGLGSRGGRDCTASGAKTRTQTTRNEARRREGNQHPPRLLSPAPVLVSRPSDVDSDSCSRDARIWPSVSACPGRPCRLVRVAAPHRSWPGRGGRESEAVCRRRAGRGLRDSRARRKGAATSMPSALRSAVRALSGSLAHGGGRGGLGHSHARVGRRTRS